MRLPTSRGPIALNTARVLLLAGLVFAVDTPVALAFQHQEHTRIADLALWLAVERNCAGAAVETAPCRAALSLLPTPCCSDESCSREEGSLTFGTYAASPDWFTHTERVVPDPEGCRNRDEESCPGDLFESCQVLDDACFDSVLATTESRLATRRRPSHFALRFLAAHLNTSHFREFAARRYTLLHRRAVGQARQGRFALALRTEAVALHFLHDLFAPGHLASARADSADPTAASLHDRFNRLGLPFVLSPVEWCPELESLAGLLDPAARRCQPPPAPHHKRTITLGAEDFESLCEVLGACDGSPATPYRAFGDGRLLDGRRLDRDRRAHRTFLVLASSLSIAQVLAGTRDSDLFAICFQRQSGRVKSQRTGRDWWSWLRKRDERNTDTGPRGDDFLPELVRPDWDSIWPPAAALATSPWIPIEPGTGYCYADHDGALAGYATRREDAEEKKYGSLTKSNPRLSVFEVSWSPIQWAKRARNGGERRFGLNPGSRLELAWTFQSTVPDSEVEQRFDGNGGDWLSGDPFRQRDFQLTWSLALHREDQPDFNAWGTGLLINAHWKLGRESKWDGYFILEPGGAYYQGTARHTTRWRGSARIGLGLSLLFFEVGAEWGYALDAADEGRREVRYFAGSRLRLPSSWLGKLRR